MKRAVFLDRDGVINHDHGYVSRIEDFHFIDGVFGACRRLNSLGYELVIVTNQAGIGYGMYTEADFHMLNRWMLEQFRQQGVDILATYYCPHHPTKAKGQYLQKCNCRKPAPGMLLKAAQEHQLSLVDSYLVGDKLSDIEAARQAGLKQAFLIKTGQKLPAETQVPVLENLNSLADYLAACA